MFEYNCKIRKIVDGDTVDVDIDLGFGIIYANQRIRLYGIDTPECRTRDLEEKKYGIKAKEYVIARMPVGSSQIIITEKDDKGKFGRILGKFKLYDKLEDRENILNDMMIRDHQAAAYFGQSKEEIVEQHLINRTLVK